MVRNAGKSMARRLMAMGRGRMRVEEQISSGISHSLRNPRGIHSMVRLVSRLPGNFASVFEGRRACSSTTGNIYKGNSSIHDNDNGQSSEGDSYSESESLWSHDEEEEDEDSHSGSGSEYEHGDAFLNDEDLWEEDDRTKAKQVESEGAEEETEAQEATSPADQMFEELSKILPGVDEDAMKKAEERFRQEQGEAARVRKEANAYLRAMKKEYDSRNLVQDEHCQKVHAKLANLKPDPDGRYRNLIEVVSDIDVLLEAYRRVKAGPGGDPSKIPLDNISMEWFYETQAKLRDGSFKLKPIKVVEVEKRELCSIERKHKRFRTLHRKSRHQRQPF